MATSAAAVIAKARRDVISHFMKANAVSEADAVSYVPDRRVRRKQFERLLDKGVLREAGPAHYWLDVPAYDQWSRGLRRRIGLAVGAATVLGAALALFAS